MLRSEPMWMQKIVSKHRCLNWKRRWNKMIGQLVICLTIHILKDMINLLTHVFWWVICKFG